MRGVAKFAFALTTLLMVVSPASAANPDNAPQGGVGPLPNGDVEVFAMSPGSDPPPRGSGRASMVCTLNYLSPGNSTGFAAPGTPVRAPDPIEGNSYFVVCLDPNGRGFIRPIVYQRAVSIIDAPTLARQAFRILPLDYPVPYTAPPRDSRHLAGVRTWMWIDPADYREVTATVEIPGLSVTATATPSSVRWKMTPDAETVTCDGPGKAYDPALPDGEQRSDCSYVYQRSGIHTATVNIDWQVTWTASDGTAGALPPVTRGVSFPVTVEQRQAIITG